MLKTLNLSPKVKLPTWALAVIGAVMVAASFVSDDLSDLREPGFAVLASAGIVLPVGFAARPGEVVQVVAPEDLLDAAPFDMHAVAAATPKPPATRKR